MAHDAAQRSKRGQRLPPAEQQPDIVPTSRICRIVEDREIRGVRNEGVGPQLVARDAGSLEHRVQVDAKLCQQGRKQNQRGRPLHGCPLPMSGHRVSPNQN